ncbi:MAG TPA: carbon monoxide dehydrogenase [Desulfobacteraceae bacterium]|nr:carbon monoxide dehydrogenase [Desulfobacteraceae bacterium]
MKIAISGKGGVGKTTFASFLIRALADEGRKVIAIDADPDANLAQALGVQNSEQIVPIAQMKNLIEERTEAKAGTMGAFFKLNPKVSDLPEKLSVEVDGVKVMVMGGVKTGGSGCICPESVLLKALVSHIVLVRDEVVILDMEAGLEHLGRATAMSVDRLVVVVEPGRRSIETAHQIRKLAGDIGIKKLSFVGNKIRSEKDRDFLLEQMPDFQFLGFIPFQTDIIEADLEGCPPYEKDKKGLKVVRGMLMDLEP